MRPKELAIDRAKGIDVGLPAVDWLLMKNDKRKQYDC